MGVFYKEFCIELSKGDFLSMDNFIYFYGAFQNILVESKESMITKLNA